LARRNRRPQGGGAIRDAEIDRAVNGIFHIAGRPVGIGHPPFVIAELSANHNGDIERAFAIIQAAREAGADAVKLQTYTAESMTIDHDSDEFRIHGGLWDGRQLYELYQEAHTPWEWHARLFEHARKLGITIFSSVFDSTAVDLLEVLNAPAYKIASFEAVDLPLIRYVANTGKPMIISTGMATVAEIDEAVSCARAAGCRELVLLKCTSNYPASPADSHLATIPVLRSLFECEVGLSDHTPGLGAAVASVALGATVIEKHLTLSRADGGVDAAFSLEPNEFAQLVHEAHAAAQTIGHVHFGPTEAERKSLVFRRSLYITEDLRAGDKLTRNNLRAIRPGYGLPPKFIDDLIGKKVSNAVRRGTPATWTLFD
jgi:N-acetylneuraminate synthase